MYATQPCSPMCSYYRMCFLATECVLLLQNVCSYYRMCALTTECVLLLQNVCSYYRMCALTTEWHVCMSQRWTQHSRAYLCALCHIIIHTMSHHHSYYVTSYIRCRSDGRNTAVLTYVHYVTSSYILCHIIIHTMSHHTYDVPAMDATQPCLPTCTMSHHHTYYVTSSFILCHIIHTMSQRWTQHSRAYLCALPARVSLFLVSLKAHIIIHNMSHHHLYYVTSYILCRSDVSLFLVSLKPSILDPKPTGLGFRV